MNEIDNEKAIIEEAPDFENQIKILEEEHALELKNRKWYTLMASMLVFVVLIFYISYSTIYTYRVYGPGGNKACNNINIKTDDSPVPNINISEGNSCIPIYNIDYYNNRKATFNIDLFGDRTRIFNRVNQMDATGSYCILNCDADNDGWPDYNLDLNGDGTADINIVLDSEHNSVCDLNCDLNYDTIPDTNIDLDGDKIADVNITGDDYKKPIYNIDYKGNRIPTFNIKGNDGTITNPVTNAKENPSCTLNCDIDNDGWPDYNIKLKEDGIILNELISEGNNSVLYDNSKTNDWKCSINRDLNTCSSTTVSENKYINIDVDGDGIPDINVSSDSGQTLTNEIGKEVTIDNQRVILNIDSNNDGFPDYNIDLNNDGIPDLNVIKDHENKCIKNCDTNNDGKADYLITYPNNVISIDNINIDYDYDSICDVNCDLDYDLKPDINIDTNGDKVPDINIDYDHDGVADFNIDLNNDGLPDLNIDAYGIGECNFNCQDNGNSLTNVVDSSSSCTKNCDTNNDGLPDKNVDINNDGVCDFNCDNGTSSIDKNNNYFLDEDENSAMLDIENGSDYDFIIESPINIHAVDIEPGWDGKYILTVRNESNYAVAYQLFWQKVTNEFTEINNLDYRVMRNNTSYLSGLKAPYKSIILKDELLISPKTTINYLVDMSWRETGVNQNIDSGKTFRGQFVVTVKK